MARVVMLTAMAGDGIDLQCGDVFETDDATAARLIEVGAATEETIEKKGSVAKKQAQPKVVEDDPEGDDADEDVDDIPDVPVGTNPVTRRPTRRR